MEKTYQHVRTSLVTFKLDYCCWLAPLRVGIFTAAYLNILISLLSLVGIANESFSPPIMKIQEMIMEDYVSKPIPILAYCTELGFNVLLLCAMYRKDTVLLRVFMYYNITTIISSTLVYSMVLPAIDVLLTFTVFCSLMFQMYMLILVRSAIVEIKEERSVKNGEVPMEFVYSNLRREHAEPEKSEPAEPITSEPETAQNGQEPANSDPELVKNKPETAKNKPETAKNKQEPVKNKQEQAKNKPEQAKNKPEQAKNKQEPVKNKPEPAKNKQEQAKNEPEIVNTEPKPDENEQKKIVKLDTVQEHPNEIRIELKP